MRTSTIEHGSGGSHCLTRRIVGHSKRPYGTRNSINERSSSVMSGNDERCAVAEL